MTVLPVVPMFLRSLCHVSSNLEGDVVNRLLLWMDAGRTHLLAHGLSELQEAGVVFGNRPLIPEEARLVVPAPRG